MNFEHQAVFPEFIITLRHLLRTEAADWKNALYGSSASKTLLMAGLQIGPVFDNLRYCTCRALEFFCLSLEGNYSFLLKFHVFCGRKFLNSFFICIDFVELLSFHYFSKMSN